MPELKSQKKEIETLLKKIQKSKKFINDKDNFLIEEPWFFFGVNFSFFDSRVAKISINCEVKVIKFKTLIDC